MYSSETEVEAPPQIEQTTNSSFNREEVVALSEKDLNFFASLLMPLTFTLFFPPLHKVIWDILKKAVRDSEKLILTPREKFAQIAIGWPRGLAKTTLVKLFVLWCIFFTKKKFILVVAANATKAENIIADICDMLSEDNVLNLWGSWKIAIETDRSALKKFSFMGRDIILAGLGSGGDPRGINIKNVRPDVIIMDDMQSKENSDSPVQAKTLLQWMTSTLAKAKSPHGCLFIYIGNMFSSPGCILKILKNNPNWTSVIVGGILADGSTLWPEFRSKEELMQELRDDIAMGTPEAFFSEIMNDPDAGITSVFDITKVPQCPFHRDSLVPASFIIIDVATDKIGADDTTIIRYAVFDGKPTAMQLLSGVFSPGETIKKALVMALENSVPVIAVESVAYQSSLLYWFEQISHKFGIEGIFFVEVFPKGRPKNSRILTMFKALLNGDLFLMDEVRAKVFWEASQFRPQTKNNTDNILDNLAYAQDVVQDYAGVIWNALSEESQAFAEASVLELNSPF